MELEGHSVVYCVPDYAVGSDEKSANNLLPISSQTRPKDEHEGTGVGSEIVERTAHPQGGPVWGAAELDKRARSCSAPE